MTTVTMYNVVPRQVRLYDFPKILVDVPLYLLLADGIRSKISNKFGSGFSCNYGSLLGFPHAAVSGVYDVGYYQNLQKMSSNNLVSGPDITQSLIFAAIIRMLHEVGHKDKDRLDFFLPQSDILVDVITQYATSVGESPFNNVKLYNVSTGEVTVRSSPPTKKSMAYELADFILRFLEQLENDALKGGYYNKVFPGESVCRESRKNEILNTLETYTFDDLKAMHEKVRLFYLEPAHFIMLSHIYLKGIFALLKTPGYVIGFSLNDGEYLSIYEYHEAKEDVHEAIYVDYPDLREREHGEADVKSFDQSLIYKVLMAVGIFFGCFYKYDTDAMKVIMSDIIFRFTSKFLYLVGIEEVKYVLGMMFSGKFETSHGNTAYQNLCFNMYKIHKLEKYKDSPYIYLLKLAIKFYLITGSFSGDDMFMSWPKKIRELFEVSLDDYKLFCKQVGLTFKYCFTKPLYAVVHFQKIGSYFREVSCTPGITFLKNQMAFVYEDGVLQGIYPYRPFKDLVFRIGNSDKSNQYIDTFYAKLLSVAYLCIGNSEVYDYISIIVKEFKTRNPGHVFDKRVCEFLTKNSMSMRSFLEQVSTIDENDSFPTKEYLRKKHDKHLISMRPMLQNFNDYYSGAKKYDLGLF